jgi:hypothetical protein
MREFAPELSRSDAAIELREGIRGGADLSPASLEQMKSNI